MRHFDIFISSTFRAVMHKNGVRKAALCGSFARFIMKIKKTKVDLSHFEKERRNLNATIFSDKMEFIHNGKRFLNGKEVIPDKENLFQSK